MSSNIDIQKKCKWCGEVFTAHKMSTVYCSHKCANLAYKERVRKERISAYLSSSTLWKSRWTATSSTFCTDNI